MKITNLKRNIFFKKLLIVGLNWIGFDKLKFFQPSLD